MNRRTNAAGERAKMRCPVCRKAFSFPVARVDQLADCPSCGERIRLLDLRVDEEPAPAKPAISATAMRPKPKPINWTWVGIGALGLIGIAVTVWALFLVPRDDPDDASATTPPPNNESPANGSDAAAVADSTNEPETDAEASSGDSALKIPSLSAQQWNEMRDVDQLAICTLILESMDVDVAPLEMAVQARELPEDLETDANTFLSVLANVMRSSPLAKVEFKSSTDSEPFVIGKRRYVRLTWTCTDEIGVSIFNAVDGLIVVPNVITSASGERHLWLNPGAYYFSIDAYDESGEITMFRK